MPTSNIEWNEEQIAQLRADWAAGLSTAEIGKRIGVSKSAVVGKSHRLELPSRPSPIKRPEGWVPPPKKPPTRREVRKPGPKTLPATPAVAPTKAPLFASVAVVTQVKPTVERPKQACCWPIGEAKKSMSQRFCDDTAEEGRPYCEEHCKLAFVNYRSRERVA